MKFLVDNQLPPALARFISEDLGSQAAHVADVGLRNANDAELWSWATRNDFIVISKDEDFVSLHSRLPMAGLLWVRIGNTRRANLLRSFGNAWPGILAHFSAGERFVELR